MKVQNRENLIKLTEAVKAKIRNKYIWLGVLSFFIMMTAGAFTFTAVGACVFISAANAVMLKIILVIAAVIVFIYYLSRAFAPVSNSKIAAIIEKIDSCHNYLSTAIDITPENVQKYGFSPELYEITVNSACDHYKAKNPETYIDYRVIKKFAAVLVILLIATGTLFLSNDCVKSFSRMWPEIASLFLPAPAEIISLNRDFNAFIGEEISIKLKFERPEDIELFICPTDDKQKKSGFDFNLNGDTAGLKNLKMQPAYDTIENAFIYLFTFNAASQNFYYAAKSLKSESYSKVYFAKMKKRPEILKVSAVYEFPGYTKISSILEENVTSLSGLYGTKIKLSAAVNLPLKKAILRLTPGGDIAMGIDNSAKKASAGFILKEKQSYQIIIEDMDGNFNKDPKTYDINVYNDNFPACEIIEPAGEINAPAEKKIDVTVKASDDFGISKMCFFYYKNEGEQESFEIVLHGGNAGEIIQKTSFDFQNVLVRPGEALYYYAAAWDNDAVSGPKMTKSAVYKINFPTQYDEALELEKVQDSIENRLEKLIDDQRAVSQKMSELNEAQKKNAMNEYELKKNFENMAKKQENILNTAKELANELKETVKKMENNIYIKPETLARINEIQQNMQNFINDDMRNVLNELNKKAEKTKLNADDVKQLSQAFDEKKLLEKFERMKELFSKVEKEQKMDTFVKELENLASKQDFVTENTEKMSPDLKDMNKELAGEQKNIKEGFNKAFDNFEKSMAGFGELSEDLKKAAMDAHSDLKNEKVSENMESAETSLAQSNPKSAFEAQKKITPPMIKAAQSLREAMESFKKKNKEDILKALSGLVETGVRMSFFMRGVLKDFESISELKSAAASDKRIEKIDNIGEKCIEISNLTRNMVGEMMSLSKKSILIDNNHIAFAGSIYSKFQTVRPYIAERQAPQALAVCNDIYARVNLLALMLIDIYDVMNNAKSGSNMDQLISMMKKQAEAQARLNEKTKGMSKPGADGMPQLSPEGMKQLAFEQQLIRQSLGRVMEGMEGNSEISRKMQEMRREMQNLEAEYLKKNINNKIQSRQKILHERLLEMQKALFKEKETAERKAETAKKFEVKPPDRIKIDPKTAEKKQELKLNEALKNEKYPKSYEKIIELYFNALPKL